MNPLKFLEAFETWGPNIDGELIQEQAIAAFQNGHWQKEKTVLLGKRLADTGAELQKQHLLFLFTGPTGPHYKTTLCEDFRIVPKFRSQEVGSDLKKMRNSQEID